MRGLYCIAALLLGQASLSCASSATPARTGAETVRIAGGDGAGMGVRIATSNEAIVRRVPVPIADAWNLMPAVYDSLGIPLAHRDQAGHVIGNPNFTVRRQLRNVRMSRYLDCGQTQIDPNADSYQINMSILTELRPRADGTTEVHTIIDARGRSIQFSGDWVRCTSNGALEARVVDVLSILLQQGGR